MALRGKVLPTLRARALSSAAPYLWNHHRACLTLDLSVIWKLTFSAELSVCYLSNVKFLSSRGNCKVFLILIPFKMIIILNELSHENIIDWQSLLTSSVGEYLCWPFVIISSNCFKECQRKPGNEKHWFWRQEIEFAHLLETWFLENSDAQFCC